MDDFQLIIYIVFLLLYFLTRGLSSRKKKKQSRPGQGKSQKPPKSFEDLIKEITGEQEPDIRKEIQEETVEKESKREYEFEEEYPSDDEIEDVYQESVKQAQDIKTIDEIIDLEEEAPKLKFKEYDKEKEVNPFATEIVQLLKNPEGAKKAIVLKEILDRKF